MKRDLTSLAVAAFAALTILGTGGKVFAQTQAGIIEGTVTDQQDAALPGVTVKLTGERVLGVQTDFTLGDGTFRFRALQPGTYDLQFELPGFTIVRSPGIILTGGRTVTLRVPLTIASLEETVTVSGAAPTVDIKQTTIAATFDTTALHAIPSATDVWGVLAQSPGVRMKGFDVGGSHKSQQVGYDSFGIQGQNQATLEGVNSTEGQSGTASYWDYYSIEEYKVSASGADVAMATPGTYIVATVKSGGNKLSGLFNLQYGPGKFVGDNVTPEKAARGYTGNPNLLFYEGHGDSGGPLIRDRLWAFGSFNYFKIDKALSGVDRKVATDPGVIYVGLGKMTLKMSDNDKLIGFLYWGNKIKRNRGLSASTPPESVLGQDFTWSSFKKLEWTRVWSSRLFTSAQFGFFSFTFPQTSRVDPHLRPPTVELNGGNVTGAGWIPFTQYRGKPAVDLTASYYIPSGRFGSHDVKLGYQFLQDISARGETAAAGPIRYVRLNGVPTQVVIADFPSLSVLPPNTRNDALPTIVDTHNDAFAQDTWTITDRLTANLGLRFGRQHVYYRATKKQPAIADSEWFPFLADLFPAVNVAGKSLFTFSKIAPRLGVTFDVTGKARTVVKASYGRYYANLADSLANTNPGRAQQRTYTFLNLSGDGLLHTRDQLGSLVSQAGGATVFAPDAPLAYSDEVQATFEQQMGGQSAVRLSYVYKTYRDAGVDKTQTVNMAQAPYLTVPFQAADPGDPTHLLNLLTTPADRFGVNNLATRFPDGAESNFDTVDVSVNSRFAGFFVQGGFDYQWRQEPKSTSPSTDPLSADPIGVAYAQNHSADVPLVQSTTVWGYKALARYDLPYGIAVSTNLRVQSGFPYARVANIAIFAGTGVRSAGAQNLGVKNVFVEPIKNNRSETVPIWDFRVDKSFRLGTAARLMLMLDAYNLLNSNAETNIFITTANYRKIIAALDPRTVQLGVRWTF